MKKKNIILSASFLILTMIITFYVIFSKHSFNEIKVGLLNLDYLYIFISILLIFLYFLIQGIYTKVIFKTLGTKYSLLKGAYYGGVEFLFSGITPSSSGGQPMVIYHMKKEGIPIKQSSIVMLIGVIFFKLFLVIGAIAILIFKPEYIIEANTLIKVCFILGALLDIFLTIFYGLLLYNQKVLKVLFTLVYKVYYKLFKKDGDYNLKANAVLAQYSQESKFIKNNKKCILISLLLVFLQRLIMFSIVYVIYKGLGLSGMSYIEMVLLQIFVQISVEPIFIPGATGISEYVSGNMFITMFGVLSTTGMLLFRLLTFYIPIFFIAFIYLIVSLLKIKKKI